MSNLLTKSSGPTNVNSILADSLISLLSSFGKILVLKIAKVDKTVKLAVATRVEGMTIVPTPFHSGLELLLLLYLRMLLILFHKLTT